MTAEARDTRPVSVDIQETEENRALIEAIEADNDELVINHFPGLVKLQAPGRLEINRESVEERLGRPWETHEFQMAIVTLAGNISEWDEDRIVLSWGRKQRDEEED
ncbi:MAG: monooxygenase [Propionibacterium sp.]|nr:monooxygenase [Propionibacterium sp.]